MVGDRWRISATAQGEVVSMKTSEFECDLCVIGSGAGAGPIVSTAANAGYRVIVLEKGPWFKESDFYKDEISCCRRSVFTPELAKERHVLEQEDESGRWDAESTSESGWDFWNGNMVGGSSNLPANWNTLLIFRRRK